MLRVFSWAVLLVLLAAGVAGCSGGRDKAAAQAVKVERPAVAVEITPARASDVDEVLELIGSVKSKFEATVRSEYTGTLADVFITEWVTVKKGDPLARLDTRDTEAAIAQHEAAVAQAQADLTATEAAAEKAARDFQRISQLKKEEIVAEQALDGARQQRDSATAQVAAARARLKATEEALRQGQIKKTKSMLVAPMDGVVAKRNANVGQFVDNMGQGEPLFRIVDNKVLDVTLVVPATVLSKVHIGQEVKFFTEYLPGKIFSAKVTHINPAADPATRAVSIVAEVANTTGELRDGLFVKARIVTGRRTGVLQVAREALLPGSSAGNAELFVVENGLARKRTVQVGGEALDTVEVTGGLKPGEPVITRGAFVLADGDPIKVADDLKAQSSKLNVQETSNVQGPMSNVKE